MTKDIADSNRAFQNGILYLLPYAIFLITAVDALFTDRVLDNQTELLHMEMVRNPINMWLVRGVSVFVLLASFKSILIGRNLHPSFWGLQPKLALCFGVFWLGSRGMNMAFSAQPYFGHEYFYSLLIGLGVLALTTDDAKKFIIAFRNASFLFLLASFLMLLIKPSLVLEVSYSQGYLGGLSRFAGLTAHAVTLGQVALVNLLILTLYPFHTRSLHRIAIVLGMFAFFWAQSKTAWIAGFVSVLIVSFYYKNKFANFFELEKSSFALFLLAIIFLVIGMLGFIFLLLSFSTIREGLFNNFENSQLITLTGRDVIWQFALNKWSENPIFGFGQQLFNLDNRLLNHMSFATSAHNQVLDLMAKSGLVGLLSFLPYLVAIWVMIFKVDLAFKGVAVAFFISIMIRCISDTPFSLSGYGIDLLIQVTLLAIILLDSPGALLNSTSSFANSRSTRRMH
jgi:hypothetical protein